MEFFPAPAFNNLGEINSVDKVTTMKNLCVEKFELGPIATNAFLIWEEGGQEAILVDAPPFCSSEINAFLNDHNLILKEIWLTHGHWDHIAGVSELIYTDAKVIAHRADEIMFQNPQLMSGFSLPGVTWCQSKSINGLRMETI